MLGPARPGQSLPETLYHMLFYFPIHDHFAPTSDLQVLFMPLSRRTGRPCRQSLLI